MASKTGLNPGLKHASNTSLFNGSNYAVNSVKANKSGHELFQQQQQQLQQLDLQNKTHENSLLAQNSRNFFAQQQRSRGLNADSLVKFGQGANKLLNQKLTSSVSSYRSEPFEKSDEHENNIENNTSDYDDDQDLDSDQGEKPEIFTVVIPC